MAFRSSRCSFLLLVLSLSLSLVCVRGDTDLIQKACQSTNSNDLCVSSLESNPDSFEADVPGLALILVKMGMDSSLNTLSYTSKLLRNNNSTDPLLQRVLKRCVDCYSNANKALKRSHDALASPETYDYAYLHVSAAMEYPAICHDMFKRSNALRFVYPSELGRREEGLQHLCDIAMGIINLLLSEA